MRGALFLWAPCLFWTKVGVGWEDAAGEHFTYTTLTDGTLVLATSGNTAAPATTIVQLQHS